MNQNENNLVEIQPSLKPIEFSIERLGDIKSKTWWKHLTPQEEAVILSLFNRIATLSNNLEEKNRCKNRHHDQQKILPEIRKVNQIFSVKILPPLFHNDVIFYFFEFLNAETNLR